MSTTYTKKLKSIAVTLVNGNTSEYADTVDEPIASNILYALQHEGGAYIQDGDVYGWFPTSAVLNISITEEDSDPITKTDGFCDGGSSEAVIIKLCQAGNAPDCYCDDSPFKPMNVEEIAAVTIGCSDVDCVNAKLKVYYEGTVIPATVGEAVWSDGANVYREVDGVMNFTAGK